MRLSLDLTVDRPQNVIRTHNYAMDLVARLAYDYALARAQMHLVQDRAKDRYDEGAVEKEIKIADISRVLQPKPKRGFPFKFYLPRSDHREVVGNQVVVLTVRGPKYHKTETLHFDSVKHASTREAGW